MEIVLDKLGQQISRVGFVLLQNVTVLVCS